MTDIERQRCERFKELVLYLKNSGSIKRIGDIAVATNTSISLITNLKSGVGKITNEMAEKICFSYSVNFNWLMFGDGEMFISYNDDDKLCLQSIIAKLNAQFADISKTLELLNNALKHEHQ